MAISLLQHIEATSSPVTFTNAVVGGSLVVCFLGLGSETPGTITATDNKGNGTYKIASPAIALTGAGESVAIIYAFNVNGGTGFQVTLTSGQTVFQMNLMEFSGIQTSADPLQGHNEFNGSFSLGTNNVASITTSSTGELLVGQLDWSNTEPTLIGNWNQITTGDVTGYQVSTTPGGYTVDANSTSTQGIAVGNAAFLPLPAGATAPFVPDMTPGTCVAWSYR